MGKSIKALSCLILMFFCFASCSDEKKDKFFVRDEFPDQVIRDFTINKYELETRKWDFFAVRGDVYEKKKKVNAKKIKMSFYEAGKISSVVSADKAILQTETGDIKAEGNVIIFSLLKNTTIFVDSLSYFEKAGKMFSDSFVRQEKPDTTITGYGLEANTDLSDITILKDVKAVVRNEKKK
ncbi:MAG: LPS export ABC transporter periplasmic protein LptC [Elusimicrobia bacterium]|nr:LPS export ABC transporter periplasmic protein LptC [Elusimicrobiota bacterium]